MADYKPNSHRFKEEQQTAVEERPKLEKIISGTAKTKPNELRKITDVFISEDIKNVKSYALMGVLVPAIKKAIYDIITNGIDMILYGEAGHERKRSTADKVSYRNYYDRDDRRRDEPRTRKYSYDDITLETRGEAEAVLSRMDELMETYGVVRVADLYDLVGITGSYTDNKYGWMDIRSAEAVRTMNGEYKLRMPRALPIDR